MVIVNAYFDESGTHGGSEATAIAGFLSTPVRWSAFESEWKHALDEFGIPMFHMNKFAVKAPPFDEWDETTRRNRIQRFLNIINAHTGCSVGVAIPMRLFDGLLSDEVKKGCGGAYGLAARIILAKVSDSIRDINPEAWIDYVFERGAAGSGEILKAFRETMKREDEREYFRIQSFEFKDKREYLPLQAADILAYELYRLLPKEPIGATSARYPLQQLAQQRRLWLTLDGEILGKFNQDMTQRLKDGYNWRSLSIWP